MIAALFLTATFLLAACGADAPAASPPTLPLPLPGATVTSPATLPDTSNPVPAVVPSSLPLLDPLAPTPNLVITAMEGDGPIDADSFAEIDIGDDPAGDAVHIMTSFTPVGPMSYYEWTDTSGDPCVGFTEDGVASWGCGSARPVQPTTKPSWLRLGASWNDDRYAITPDPLPESAVAIEVLTDTNYRIRTTPVSGYAILADTFEQGVPVQVIVYFDDGTQLAQATNFAFAGAPLN